MSAFKTFLTILGIIFLSIFLAVRGSELIKKNNLESPVLGVSKDRISDNVWYPKIENLKNLNFPDAPEVTAVSALFMDTSTGEILYSKDPEHRLSIASLTKIMTTIVALENRDLSEKFKVSAKAASIEPDKMFLIPDEKLTLKELLTGIFLISANDAAETIAEGTTGSRSEFIQLMNSKASQLGMSNTFFVNPTGLEEDPEYCQGRVPCEYSSALDVAIMSRYLIHKWPEVVNISSEPHIYLERTSDHQDYDMYSGINLLTTYPGVMGLKTGFTPEAGLTLVTLARKNNSEVLGVLLGAVDRREDAKALLDYCFSKLSM